MPVLVLVPGIAMIFIFSFSGSESLVDWFVTEITSAKAEYIPMRFNAISSAMTCFGLKIVAYFRICLATDIRLALFLSSFHTICTLFTSHISLHPFDVDNLISFAENCILFLFADA